MKELIEKGGRAAVGSHGQSLATAREIGREDRSFPLFEIAGGDRYGSPLLVRPRLGQGTFRIAVTEAYGRACAITGEHSLPALEAAHIQSYRFGGPHEIANGCCCGPTFVVFSTSGTLLSRQNIAYG